MEISLYDHNMQHSTASLYMTASPTWLLLKKIFFSCKYFLSSNVIRLFNCKINDRLVQG